MKSILEKVEEGREEALDLAEVRITVFISLQTTSQIYASHLCIRILLCNCISVSTSAYFYLYLPTITCNFVNVLICASVNLYVLGDVHHLPLDPGGAGGDALQAHHLPALLQWHHLQRQPRLPLVHVRNEEEKT